MTPKKSTFVSSESFGLFELVGVMGWGLRVQVRVSAEEVNRPRFIPTLFFPILPSAAEFRLLGLLYFYVGAMGGQGKGVRVSAEIVNPRSRPV